MESTAIALATDLRAMEKRMEDQGIILNAQMMKTIHDLKLDPTKHFYKVGSYKDANNQWQPKMEPTAYLLQTMATVQHINTKIIEKIWENPDDLQRAAVSIRMKGWKGNEDRPEIVKDADLRLSMRTIAQRYVMDKLTPKKGYGDKPGKDAEWKEEDVEISSNGWMQPMKMDKKIAMFSYLADQLNFLDRNAETKAERRLNMKLLGFEWREGEEMQNDSKEVEIVRQETKPEPHIAFEELKTKIDRVRTDSGLEKLKKEISATAWNANEQRALVDAWAERKALIMNGEVKEEPELTEDEKQEAAKYAAEAEETEPKREGKLDKLFGKK